MTRGSIVLAGLATFDLHERVPVISLVVGAATVVFDGVVEDGFIRVVGARGVRVLVWI